MVTSSVFEQRPKMVGDFFDERVAADLMRDPVAPGCPLVTLSMESRSALRRVRGLIYGLVHARSEGHSCLTYYGQRMIFRYF